MILIALDYRTVEAHLSNPRVFLQRTVMEQVPEPYSVKSPPSLRVS